MTGPVQILVIGLDEPTFSGEVMAEFARLREAGTVQLLDVVLIAVCYYASYRIRFEGEARRRAWASWPPGSSATRTLTR